MKIVKKKIAIFCDLNNSSGLGHLIRMKNVSTELEKKGSECCFLFNKSNRGHVLKHTKNLRVIFFSKNKKVESIKKIIVKNNFSIIILDSYEDNLY